MINKKIKLTVLQIIIILLSLIIPIALKWILMEHDVNALLWFSGVLSCALWYYIEEKKDEVETMQYKEDDIVYWGKYFFIVKEIILNKKTPILYIFSNDKTLLGNIKWYGAWRKFCFYPNKDSIWDNYCLNDLTNFLEQYNKEWRQKYVKNIKKDIS